MSTDPDDATVQLDESTKDSIEKLRSLVEDLKSVQEHEGRTVAGNRYVTCDEIDDDLVKLYALGRLPDAIQELITHLETCEKCRRRVAEAQLRAKAIKNVRGAATPS